MKDLSMRTIERPWGSIRGPLGLRKGG